MRIAACLAVIVSLLCISRAAEAGCKRGKLLFRIESYSKVADDGSRNVLEVRTTGRWIRTGDDAASGCLSKKQLARVSKAVKRARFAFQEGAIVCDATSTDALVYRGAKASIETESPCGRPVDAGTDIAARCTRATVSPSKVGVSLAESCAPPPPDTCKRGALLFRSTTTPLAGGPDTGAIGEVTEVRSKGAWSHSENGAEIASGCLGEDHLALVKRAVKRAKFKKTQPEMRCMAMSTIEITYQGPKKKQQVTIAAPCGDQVDDWTRTAAECLAAVSSGSRADTVSLQCDRAED